MHRCLKLLAALAMLGALGGALVAWSGVINVGASTGHWKLTDWVLHAAMRQSVETHSSGIEVPPLDSPALARRGAGHYAASCAPCHGGPGVARSAVTRAMTPPPPYLPAKVPAWQDAELFWIVRHGVKFTGMPAWPALQRSDEVWAMVAFLRRLPELDAAGYERLAYGEARAAAPEAIAEQAAQDSAARDGAVPGGAAPGGAVGADPAGAGCRRCHGDNGAGSGAFPRLAGQQADYLFGSLKAFAEGRRHSGFMAAAASGLDEAAMRALAEHYAAAPAPQDDPQPAVAGDRAAGGEIARRGDPAAGVPACAACHGLEAGPRYPHYPRLAGQQAWYLAQQLRLLKAGTRGGTPYAHIMQAVAGRLSDAQIDALAAFYAGLPAD